VDGGHQEEVQTRLRKASPATREEESWGNRSWCNSSDSFQGLRSSQISFCCKVPSHVDIFLANLNSVTHIGNMAERERFLKSLTRADPPLLLEGFFFFFK